MMLFWATFPALRKVPQYRLVRVGVVVEACETHTSAEPSMPT